MHDSTCTYFNKIVSDMAPRARSNQKKETKIAEQMEAQDKASGKAFVYTAGAVGTMNNKTLGFGIYSSLLPDPGVRMSMNE